MRYGYFIITFYCLLLNEETSKAKGLLILNGHSSHHFSPPSPFMPCHAFSLPSLPLSPFIHPIARWMCHKPCFSKLGMHGKHQGPIPRNWFCGAAPRKLHLMSTVGTRVSGLRTTLEVTLLKTRRDRRRSLPLKSSRFSGNRQTGYVMQYWQKPMEPWGSGEGDQHCWLVRKGSIHSVLWKEYVPWVSVHQSVNCENIRLKPENLFINHTWILLLICILKMRKVYFLD